MDDEEWEAEPAPYLWCLSLPDPGLLVAAGRARRAEIEEWPVTAYDRTVLNLRGLPMHDGAARHLWAVTAPLGELAAAGEPVRPPGAEGWELPGHDRAALTRFGLPASLFGHRAGAAPGAPRVRDDGGRYLLDLPGPGRSGRVIGFVKGGGAVLTPDGAGGWYPLASSAVAFTEIGWRWHWIHRTVDGGLLDGCDELAEAEDDFADLVRWIDPASRFAELYPVSDLL
ncbi:SUKH-4 family immunity protein [Allonocardiopsis opalescens]|uniref:SUKH-4 immunity protein of toxin-antitoxin system n=1 Tax=Allonocardiopsis opalescens TaxID=1144618 RepID=A0A2T0PV73_9ACTN|nr:SUKH-4 family immunity protein [Allonocardiopsis opalescens]PRX95436.1 SUKH-4 immunity protein of toxin-antitoxin system [Allonocardiopsis opalescens]